MTSVKPLVEGVLLGINRNVRCWVVFLLQWYNFLQDKYVPVHSGEQLVSRTCLLCSCTYSDKQSAITIEINACRQQSFFEPRQVLLEYS